MVTRLHFLGATRTVTGSCFLVQHGHTGILIDCGLIQGPMEMLARNREPFAFDPTHINVLVLTHAHLDHTGLVPRLVEEGFRRRILTTSITKELLRVVWEDFAHLQQHDFTGAGSSRAAPVKPPLYTQLEVERALSHCEGCSYNELLTISPSIRLRFRDAGHILGSAIVELWVEDLKIVFSGDLGHRGKPIMRDPTMIEDADALILESTYGDRNHRTMPETMAELGRVIAKTLSVGGLVLMPVYAIGRSQEVLYAINQLTQNGVLDRPRVFLDSPMAIQATDVYGRHVEAFDEEAKRLTAHPPSNPRAPLVTFTESIAESRSIARGSGNGAIILAGSGMCEGGRILDHLARYLADPRSSVIFTGYQVEGTLGRRLVDGAKSIRLRGQGIPVKARIHTINGFSAHADQAGLLDWVGGFRDPKPSVFLVHGELPKMTALADALLRRYGVKPAIPEWREMVLLSDQRQR